MYRDLIDDLDGFQIEPAYMLDVPFVPTDEIIIDALFKLGNIQRDDVIYDLGAGDGRILIEAAQRFQTQGIGVELDPQRIADAMEEAANARVEHLVDFVEGSFFDAEIQPATIVFLYLLETVNLELRPRLLKELRPGTQILAHTFDMGNWEPDQHIEIGCVNLYQWIIPAQVAGTWQWECLEGHLYEIELEQSFQKVRGHVWCDDQRVDLNDLQLQGPQLTLQITLDDKHPAHRGQTQTHQFILHFDGQELVSVEQDESDDDEQP